MRLATREEDEEPMVDGATARAWLAREGFAEGDLRSAKTVDGYKGRFPMAWACQEGELGMCKWLHENGAAADITNVYTDGASPSDERGFLADCYELPHLSRAARSDSMRELRTRASDVPKLRP